MRSSLATYSGVRPAELERVLLMLAFSVLAVGGIVITGQLLGRSLFLSSVPTESIPLRFIVPPLVLVGTIALYTRLSHHIRKSRLILLTLAAMLCGVLCARWMLGTAARETLGFLLGLFTFFEVAAGLTMILFWTLASDIFTSREAKRLFPLISGGSALSNVAFGVFLVRGATTMQPENLTWIIAVSVALSILIVIRLMTRYRLATEHRVGFAEPAPIAGWAQGVREVFGSPLMRVVAAIVIVVALVGNLADYQLDLALKSNYAGDTQAMVRLLALVRLGAGILAVILQFFVASWLMGRFGILPVLLMLPLAVAFGSTAIVLTGGALWAVTIPRAADFSLKYTVHDSAFNLLYMPLPAALRSRAKAVVDGMIKPLLVCGLGLTFLALARLDGVDLVLWSWPVLALVALWIWLLARGAREYVRALARSLLMRRLDLGCAVLDLSDETSTKVLVAALEQTDSLRILHTISLLRESSERDWSERMVPLTESVAPEVRGAALRYLGERADPRYAAAARGRLNDGDAGVRCEAVEAFGRLLGVGAVRELVPILEDAERKVRGATLVALIRHGGLSGFLHAGRPLHELLEDPETAARVQGAELLGELAVQGFYGPLLELIGDSDAAVRRAAVRAAERVAAPELLPGLLASLDDPALRQAGIPAICACAAGDVGRVEALINDRALPAAVSSALVASLGSLGASARPILTRRLEDDRAWVRAAAYTTILKSRATGEEPGIGRTRGFACLERELREAFERRLCIADLNPNPGSLLAESMENRAQADHARVLASLALAYPDLAIDDLRKALGDQDLRLRANAVELLDNVVVTGKSLLIPYLAGTDAEKLVVAERRLGLHRQPRIDRLRALIDGEDPWLAACAFNALDDDERRRLEPDELVKQAATQLLQSLDGPKRGATEGSSMALAPLEKILFLKQVPLFHEIPGEQLAGMTPIVTEMPFRRGDTIIRQGDVGDALYIIVEGNVRIEIDGRDTGKVLGSREVIGELAILTGDARAATCTAIDDVLTLRIAHEPFWNMMREQPEITIGVMRIVLGYLKQR